MRTRAVAASLTDVGRKRRSNQDHYAEFPGDGGAMLLVCCDGMGGHLGGEVASRMAVTAIGASFGAGAGDPGERLLRAFQEAHRRVREESAQNPALAGMGTTGVALYYDGDARAWTAHVGDSRAYRLRDDRLEQLTQDHSVVAELLRLGRITAEAAALLPANELTRAIGAGDEMEVDLTAQDVRAGDRFLLCSDGLWSMLSDGEIAERLRDGSPAEVARRLVDRANEEGGVDNVTVQVLAIGDAPAPPRRPSRWAWLTS